MRDELLCGTEDAARTAPQCRAATSGRGLSSPPSPSPGSVRVRRFNRIKKKCAKQWVIETKRDNSTRCSKTVTNSSTNRARLRLAFEIGRDRAYSQWYDRCRKSVCENRAYKCVRVWRVCAETGGI